MILLVNKPQGWTSFDVVAKLRSLTHERRIGHAGTLDPMATGVLVVAVTRESTKTLNTLSLADKTYLATIKLDGISDTLDAVGKVEGVKIPSSLIPKLEQVKLVLNQFIGSQMQIPPQYSAIKIGGIKAYDSARKGIKIELEPRPIVINSLRLMSYNWPHLSIEVDCSKGTYIRSLARDIGQKLNVGGYLTSLMRTRVGQYRLEDCLDIASAALKYNSQRS